MMKRFVTCLLSVFLLIQITTFEFCSALAQESALVPEHPKRLPTRVDGRLVAPDLGCWFPRVDDCAEQDGFQPYAQAVLSRGAFDVLCVSSRLTQQESGDAASIATLARFCDAFEAQFGVKVALDAEIRLSRKAFETRFPNCLLEGLEFKEISCGPTRTGRAVEVLFPEESRSDHYTHNYRYWIRSGRLVKVWSYQKNAAGEILPETIQEQTQAAKFDVLVDHQSREAEGRPDFGQTNLYRVTLPAATAENQFYCVGAAFAFLYPDLFAPESLEFERELIEKHAPIRNAAGFIKDEWGFLPCADALQTPQLFWFSDAMSDRYARQTQGRSLADDCFLMYLPQAGRNEERIVAANDYNTMKREQALQFEIQLYDLTKRFWGEDAYVGTHPTWYPAPIANEFRKNGLMWWRHPRDYAQTDEVTPFCCRTGMSKIAPRPIWYNEYYATEADRYLYETWTCAAGAGRVNVHPFCPAPVYNRETFGMIPILDRIGPARAKIRMLNFVQSAPLECPVAVVFGHASVMNPALPEFDRVFDAIRICDAFAQRGIPADLIPSSEIQRVQRSGKPCWAANDRGLLQYGNQPYRLVIEFARTPSDEADFAALERLRDSAGRNTELLSVSGEVSNWIDSEVGAQVERLAGAGVQKQTPWTTSGLSWNMPYTRPRTTAFSRLADGTLLWTAGSAPIEANADSLPEEAGLADDEKSDLGDGAKILLDGVRVRSNDGSALYEISAEAAGILACRFDESGALTALTAAELKHFRAGGVSLDLTISEDTTSPIDVSLWKDANGAWVGVFQASENRLPEECKRLTPNWRYLERPGMPKAD